MRCAGTALRYLPSLTYRDAEATLSRLLLDGAAPIRLWAIEKAGEGRFVAMVDAVAALTTDPTVLWDLDEELAIAQVAARAVERLARIADGESGRER